MTAFDDTRVYHRVGDRADAIAEIKRTGKLKGCAPRNIFQSPYPTVQAYVGPLPPGECGFEFTTEVSPDAGCPPLRANWRACTEANRSCRQGIEVEVVDGREWAVIAVTVGKVQ
jgi:hypothetical protein